MAYLSEIIGRPVIDLDGKHVGKLIDVIVRPWAEFPHPLIEAIVVENKTGLQYLPFAAVAALFSPAIPLKYRSDEAPVFELMADDVLLSRDVLDKQIIDTDGARVVRVNDVDARYSLLACRNRKLQHSPGVFRKTCLFHDLFRVRD